MSHVEHFADFEYSIQIPVLFEKLDILHECGMEVIGA
jgi:hypothetical protein